jgi:hypothetical protein
MNIQSFLIGYQAAKKGGDMDEIDTIIDEINGEVINGKVVTFKGLDGSVLCQISVVPGYNCTDPTLTGLIEKPVKASTETQVFTFNGWSLIQGGEADPAALKNVTEDRTVYPAFAATTRLYTVRFYDGNTLLATKTVEYGGSTEHTYGKNGYYFNGWDPEPVNITKDTDCYAQMVLANFAADDWSTIVATAENGNAADKYKVGDTREMALTINGKTETITVQIAGFNVDTLENGGKAGMSIIAKNPLADPVVWNGTNHPVTEAGNAYAYTRYGFDGADLRTYLDNTVAASFPAALKNALKKVQKSYNYYNGLNSSKKATAAWKMWIPSAYEVTGLSTYSDGNGYRYSALYPSDDARIATLYGSDQSVKWWTTTVDGAAGARYITASGSVGVSTGNVDGANAYVIFGFCI